MKKMEVIDHTTKMTADKYKKEIDELFATWKSSVNTNNTAFITDGVMNPDKWFEQNERIMFVLKEAHSEGYSYDWDLARDHVLRKENLGKYPTWRNISLWTKGLQNPTADYDPKDVELKVMGNKYLQTIAAVNIKKYNGKKKSENSEINDFAIKHKDYICQEIALCDPTVIVCCGTANALNNIINFGYDNFNEEHFYHTIINKHDVIVLDFYHPANRFPKIMNYLVLCSMFQRAKNDQIKRLKNHNTSVLSF